MKILVIAPHPDDETLGAGGSLLRWKNEGAEIFWFIVTSLGELGSEKRKAERQLEIEKVAELYGFTRTYLADFPTTQLDQIPLGKLIQKMSEVMHDAQPDTLLVPFQGDVHSDHGIVFAAANACSKWFRYPFLKKVLAYETLSETHFSLDQAQGGFRPNYYVNIAETLEKKIEIMNLYQGEMGEFPFPRSVTTLRSLAQVRGSEAGYPAAEAFILLRQRV